MAIVFIVLNDNIIPGILMYRARSGVGTPFTRSGRADKLLLWRKDVVMSFLKALRLPQIALLWTSQVLSAMGDYFYTIAVMWIAVKTSGSSAGFVAAAEAVAMFVFGLLGGVYADRWNRRITMIMVDAVRA